LALSLPTGALLVRIFIVQHDCVTLLLRLAH
jgi:hypothetical protein